jgi:hypothetical protein
MIYIATVHAEPFGRGTLSNVAISKHFASISRYSIQSIEDLYLVNMSMPLSYLSVPSHALFHLKSLKS